MAMIVLALLIVMIMMSLGRFRLALKRRNDKRAWKSAPRTARRKNSRSD